jgi:negative regulator of genetic competence, sporulation and motility
MNDDEIVHLAEKIEKENLKNIFTFMRQSHDVSDFIEILRSWLTVSWMDHTVVNRNDSYYLNIQHDLGIKWSLYVKILVSELYQDILGKRVGIDISDNLISFIFSKE